MPFQNFIVLAAFALRYTSANFAFSSPVAGQVCAGGNVCTVSWTDDGTLPSVASYGEVDIGLYVGLPDDLVLVSQFQRANPNELVEIEPLIDPTVASDGDFYQVRVASRRVTDTTGNPLAVLSSAFTLAGMTGTLSADQQTAVTAWQAANNQVANPSTAVVSITITPPATSSSSTSVSSSSTSTEPSPYNTVVNNNFFGSGAYNIKPSQACYALAIINLVVLSRLL